MIEKWCWRYELNNFFCHLVRQRKIRQLNNDNDSCHFHFRCEGMSLIRFFLAIPMKINLISIEGNSKTKCTVGLFSEGNNLKYNCVLSRKPIGFVSIRSNHFFQTIHEYVMDKKGCCVFRHI